jgi:alanyl-tRNA synthetase
MPEKKPTGGQIRQEFIDFFKEKHHTFVPSSSLVPGGDQTLLFTNAGMVQFKDVFIGIDKRPYSRAANSQKCMRVAGKHNDLDDVGRDDTHHTFFEMLGNWSFGDYYKKEAIAWAWELLTDVWELPKEHFYTTCFEDEKGEIERDDEAAEYWRQQSGFDPSHVLFFGRKDNFWEMAETGPCGPCSEIHFDQGPEYCDKQDETSHVCEVNGNCQRFLELWNLVFIQYNRHDQQTLETLPSKHVDTGMGFERIVSVLQSVDSNYKIDLLDALMNKVQELTGQNDIERAEHLTPYRVIADHTRAATFLIADGVVPGNTGRNYVCRMIIRRAARFGSMIGLIDPFMAQVADVVIENYSEFYPELIRNRDAILDNLTREEERFQRTVESGVAKLDNLLDQLNLDEGTVMSGEQAFDLYATYGLPLEITRDIAREKGLDVDEIGFQTAMEEHRQASGAGETFGEMDDEGVERYRLILAQLQSEGKLSSEGVVYNPYDQLQVQGAILALMKTGLPFDEVQPGDTVEVLMPETCFYVEAGGQVSDTGIIRSTTQLDSMGLNGGWEIRVDEMRKPAAGVIVHIGEVLSGKPNIGDDALASVDAQRRVNIMRNHTATHLLHFELRSVLGEHARQAGSLVAPDRLRFDFTHPQALTTEQITSIEAGVNYNILGNYPLEINIKPLQTAINEGATALFGEKYDETVRTITIDRHSEQNKQLKSFSYELCGGTHVGETGDVGLFLITSESSVGAGLRRIEAVTGRGAYQLVQRRLRSLGEAAALLDTSPDLVPEKTKSMTEELVDTRKQISILRRELTSTKFESSLEVAPIVAGVPVLTAILPGADADTLRQMTDRFRQFNPSGVIVLGTESNSRPLLVAAVTEDLVKRGLHAGELVKMIAEPLGGSGGGRPNLAQAGGKDASKMEEALALVPGWVEGKLLPE